MDKTAGPGRVKGTLTPPCSKSYAQRALAAALLSEEVSVLRLSLIHISEPTRH